MNDNKIYEDFSQLQKRSQIVFILIELAFLFLAFYYWKIQILEHWKYWSQSEANRTREVVVPAPRGILTDRTGSVILADNKASFKASIIRENCKNFAASCLKIGRLLGLDEDVIKKRIEKYKSLPLFRPIAVKEDLTLEEVARIEARKMDFPELVIETEPKRFYPFEKYAAHAIGYLQELTMEELRGNFKDRRLGDMAGKTGVEAAYDSRLVGVEGKIIEVVDSLGRKREELERIEPKPCRAAKLTLDFDLQSKAQELLAGKEGAIVVLEPKTGEILAMASFPTFDPNKFINRFTPEEWLGLINSPEYPLVDRVIQGHYSPGSIFKLVMAASALASGTINEQTTFFCGGTEEFYGNPFKCTTSHGSLNLTDAIRYSCNIYFYNLGRRLGIDDIARYAKILGLGEKTGIDIPGEKEGLVPTAEWKKKVKNVAWYPGETISVAIGQGPLQVTPLQIACLTAVIANRGLKVRPHLVLERPSAPGPEPSSAVLSGPIFEKIIEGMWRSVNAQGTGRAARVENFEVCGKTGSTQTMSAERAEKLSPSVKQKKTHSWFTGFAPRNNPRVTVTILVEYGGLGGATAAPLAKELFELYKKKYDRQGSIPGS
jgi:penicillin-binding protein 2